MTKRDKKSMKLIPAPEELVSKLSEASNREGKLFFDYISEAFEQALKAHKMSTSLKEIVDFYEIMMMQKEAALIIIPPDTLNIIIEKVYPQDKELLEKTWFDSGMWYGKYLLTKIRNSDPVEVFGKILKTINWNLKDVDMEKGDSTVTFRCISFTLSLVNTILLMKFVEGVMSTLGYEVSSREYLRGMIDIQFKKIQK